MDRAVLSLLSGRNAFSVIAALAGGIAEEGAAHYVDGLRNQKNARSENVRSEVASGHERGLGVKALHYVARESQPDHSQQRKPWSDRRQVAREDLYRFPLSHEHRPRGFGAVNFI